MKSLLTPLMCALLAAPAFAQEKPDTGRQPSADQRIADLERRLDAMSRELETQKAGATMPAVPEEGRFGLAPSASKVYAVASGLSIGGYGEFLYQNFDSKLQDGTRAPRETGLDALRLVLYTGYKFNEHIVFNSEIEFEHGGYSDESTGGEAKVEFAYLDFLFTKAVNLRAGMMLLPVGFMNEMHEPPAFLGSQRPLVERRIREGRGLGEAVACGTLGPDRPSYRCECHAERVHPGGGIRTAVLAAVSACSTSAF